MKLGNKTLEVPIIQGGMGVGISLSGLAGAVMKEGAMGVISAAHPGYRKPNFWEESKKCNCDAICEEVEKAKEIAGGKGICAVNVMVASKDYEAYIQACIDAKADAIISGAGLPLQLPDLVQDADILIAPIVSSKRAAQLILKAWDRHAKRIPDFIVIEGSEAGGHLGFKKEDLLDGTCESLDEILPQVLACVKPYEEQYQKKIPVFVAGGIYNGLDIMHFMEMGASGVQMATRFIATYECDASDAFKQAIIKADKKDMQIVKSPTGLPGRAVLTPFMQKTAIQRIPAAKCIACMHPCTPSTTPYCISEALIHSAQGDVENGLVFAGSNAYRINKMMHVHDLIKELTNEMKQEAPL